MACGKAICSVYVRFIFGVKIDSEDNRSVHAMASMPSTRVVHISSPPPIGALHDFYDCPVANA